MKQILTVFRAEGPQAARLIRLCRTTRKAQFLGLRDVWRLEVRCGARFSGYVEYMDYWSMGDDFARVMGAATRRRETPKGELYFGIVTTEMRAELQQQARRKQQFPERVVFVRILAGLVRGCGACDRPVALAVFREIVGASTSDEEMKNGADHPLVVTAHGLADRQR